ncbi:MAG: AMP-dependent synthetase [Hydrocarboniphaga sp.]|uniref:class I adenylate-forming enzyme family protein n=1 Tax=Hydrocarboniphaga sp. TaxID=2033016 RepID=UPI00262E688E|nr:AMP-binding protein [Hydrocarboniphaga sp.]MDB5972346.1 AMP-dependent synthetase [Hydrocarboniphaga sp.]
MTVSSTALGKSYLRADWSAEFLGLSVGDLLRQGAHEVPDRLALIAPKLGETARQWTYAELLAEAEKTAYALLRRFEPGDRVATWAGGSAEILMLHLGAALAGIVLVTLNPANRAGELEYLLQQSRSRGLVLERVWRSLDNQAVIEALQPSLPALQTVVYLDQWNAFVADAPTVELPVVKADDLAMILFTSGTTGKPKGAMLRQAGIVNNARFTASRLEVPTGSVWLNLLPMFHVGGSVTMSLGCLSNLGTQVLVPDFSAEAMLDAIERYGVRATMAVPTMLVAMLQSERFAGTDLSKLEVIVTGGTIVAPELVREVKAKTGAEIMTLFGQTEAGGAMFVTRRGDDIDRVTQSAGLPLPLSEAKVISSAGEIVPIGVVGEVCVRTRCCMQAYFGMPEKSAEALDAEGWIHTGDLGVMRPDGYVQVTGRLKDMIIRGGENLYPREIEDRLAEHPAVAQSAVFGVPDVKWGEQVAAAVIFRGGQSATADELVEFLRSRIARHKVPKFWHVVDTLPVNASGKIQKFMLREQFAPKDT